MLPQQILTSGSFASEESGWEFFDECVGKSGAFRIYKEVDGDYVSPRPATDLKGARIDRILMPLAGAINAGWTHGAIGVECKNSGKKLGKALCQALDYTRCVFELKEGVPGLLIMLRWVFLYPLEFAEQVADIGSVMANNRIGYAHPSYDGGLIFGCGGSTAMRFAADGKLLEAKLLPMGGKRGSR